MAHVFGWSPAKGRDEMSKRRKVQARPTDC
jgi:hypothetical protein